MSGNFDLLRIRRRRMTGSLVLAAAVAASLPAVAQEAAGTLEEVIVKAQKRMKVPHPEDEVIQYFLDLSGQKKA